MVMCMKEIGLQIKQMDMEFINITVEHSTKEIGKMICNMEMGKRSGLMDLNMKVCIRKDKSTGKESTNGLMGQNI